jgi:DinB family protein
MRLNRPLSVFLLPSGLALALLFVCFFASQAAQAQSAQRAEPPRQPTAAEMSKKETVASAFLRGLEYQEYEVRSAAEAMPEEKYGYRPAEGKFKNEKPEFGPAEVRTFAQQVKHAACANFCFAAELDGQAPPPGCDKDGPNPAKTKKELLIYLRDSFAATRKSLGAIDAKNMFDPIEGPYAGPNTRLGIATVIVWHNADHYGQMALYLRENNIVPPPAARIRQNCRTCTELILAKGISGDCTKTNKLQYLYVSLQNKKPAVG